MFGLRSIYMHIVFCVVFLSVSPKWTHYNGLWYYVSDDTDKLTYGESVGRCTRLQGRLAVLSGWQDDMNKLASFTGSTKRWVYGDPPRVIYESENLCVIQNSMAYAKYGYICDWQCHSLRVYPQVTFNGTFDMECVYDMPASNGTLRKFYSTRKQSNTTHSRIYQKWKGNNSHIWCFEYFDNHEDYVCKASTHFTPYNGAYLWEYIDTLIHPIEINFFCHDCWEYGVSLSLLSPVKTFIKSGIFYRTPNVELEVYTSPDVNGYLEYESDDNVWCLKWSPYVDRYCFNYSITPTVNHKVEHMSVLDTVGLISLSCASTTFPIQQSTVASMERNSAATITLDATETTMYVQSMVTNSPIQTETTSFVTNSQTAETATDEPTRTTMDPRSDSVNSDNKTTMYIAIACSLGGVVIIIMITLVVCGRRRMKNKRKRDTEQNIQNDNPKSKANMYSVDTQSTNYAEIKDSSIEVKNKTGKENYDPLYQKAKDPTTENVYSEAEAVDLNTKHMYINGGFLPGSEKSKDISGIHISDTKTDKKSADDDDDSDTEFFNNDIYEGSVKMDRKSTEVPQPVPVKSPSGSDIEMYKNSLYGACGKDIAQNNKSELVKNMDSVDEDIEMYDNDLYGS